MAFDVLLNPSQGTDVQFFLARGKRIINHNNFGICHFLRPPTRRLVGISSKPADFFFTVLSRRLSFKAALCAGMFLRFRDHSR